MAAFSLLAGKPWSARWEQGGSAEEQYRCAAVFSGNQQFNTVQRFRLARNIKLQRFGFFTLKIHLFFPLDNVMTSLSNLCEQGKSG